MNSSSAALGDLFVQSPRTWARSKAVLSHLNTINLMNSFCPLHKTQTFLWFDMLRYFSQAGWRRNLNVHMFLSMSLCSKQFCSSCASCTIWTYICLCVSPYVACIKFLVANLTKDGHIILVGDKRFLLDYVVTWVDSQKNWLCIRGSYFSLLLHIFRFLHFSIQNHLHYADDRMWVFYHLASFADPTLCYW